MVEAPIAEDHSPQHVSHVFREHPKEPSRGQWHIEDRVLGGWVAACEGDTEMKPLTYRDSLRQGRAEQV